MNKGTSKIKYVLLVLGAFFIAYGLIKGDVSVVLNKATAICLECIGIG